MSPEAAEETKLVLFTLKKKKLEWQMSPEP